MQIDLSKPLETSQELEKPTFSRSNAVTVPEEDPGERGGFTDRDAARPRVQLLQALSKVAGEHPEWTGKFCLGLPPAVLGNELEFVIASVQKVFVEDRAGKPQSAEMPKLWMREADARSSGLPYLPGAIAVVFVNVTALDDAEQSRLGAMVIEDESWAPCEWWMVTKSSYPVITQNLTRIGIGKTSGHFGGVWRGARLRYRSKKVENKKGQGGFFFVPEFVSIEKTGPELLKAIEDSGLARTPKPA